MATHPRRITNSDRLKDGIIVYKIDSLPAATLSDPIDCAGAKKLYAVGANTLTFRAYDEDLDDGTAYALVAGSGVVNGTTGAMGHVDYPPGRICIHVAATQGNVYIVVVRDRMQTGRS